MLALLYGAVILVAVIVVVQLFRRQWIAAGLGVVGAGVLYAIYWSNDTLPSDLIPYTAALRDADRAGGGFAAAAAAEGRRAAVPAR